MKLMKNAAWVFGFGALLTVACGQNDDDGGDGDGSGGMATASGGNTTGDGAGGDDGTPSGGSFNASGGRNSSSAGGEGGLGGDGPVDPNTDLSTCDEVEEPCCEAEQGPAQCGGGLVCEGFGPNAVCQEPPDTSECDTVGDECCEGSGFGPGICAEGLTCERMGQGQDATTTCQEDEGDDEEVDTTECDEVGEECCSTGQGPGGNVCENGLECAWGGQEVGLVCEAPE